jgi:hypothetical protein
LTTVKSADKSTQLAAALAAQKGKNRALWYHLYGIKSLRRPLKNDARGNDQQHKVGIMPVYAAIPHHFTAQADDNHAAP